MKNQEFYSNALNRDVHEYQKVGWENIEKAQLRYEKIAETIGPQHKTILDYGCGLGSFSQYLNAYPDKKYVGVDIQKEYIELAKQQYPDRGFLHIEKGDLLNIKTDCIVNIGAYTLCYDTDHQEYWNEITEEIRHQSTLTKSIIVNGFHNQVDYYDHKLFYHDLNKWIKLANELDMHMHVEIYAKYEFILKLSHKM